jgi:hypothetical protein
MLIKSNFPADFADPPNQMKITVFRAFCPVSSADASQLDVVVLRAHEVLGLPGEDVAVVACWRGVGQCAVCPSGPRPDGLLKKIN